MLSGCGALGVAGYIVCGCLVCGLLFGLSFVAGFDGLWCVPLLFGC